MPLTPRRPLLLGGLALGALLLAAAPGDAAATKVSFVDGKGDALASQASMDIVRTTLETTGTTTTTKVRGKKVTTFTPTAVAVSLQLASAPSKDAGRKYVVEGTMSGCGTFTITHSPSTALGGYNTMYFGCGGETSETGSDALIFDISPKITGSTITWRIPLKSFPKDYRRNAVVTDLRSFTTLVEPVTGILSPAEFVAASAIDMSTSNQDFHIQ